MDRNPFEVTFSAEFENLQEESIDFLMLGIRRTNELANKFNPWHHRAINHIVGLITIKANNQWANNDTDEYIGLERRSKARDLVEEFLTSCRRNVTYIMMPKTKKIEPLDKVA